MKFLKVLSFFITVVLVASALPIENTVTYENSESSENSVMTRQEIRELIKTEIAKELEDVKDKFSRIDNYLKEKRDNAINIAKEFIDHTKGVLKDVAVEALEFLRPYKEDLGSLWDQVKETVKDIANKKEDR
ncbi:unnamed protein product [Bursaphelenchus okinawaensis]|uniref:Uncharacterized protein n=1 Tax=Bursaphelenchus okinawaensis TaxID=465554 RepID=A0A811L1M7_9BILA|nr:unnamed protein product [Bursaphelenchus okinawaensis]CAG9114872.1 unnamed protein product [Bursaphelenchus okinawaensis]